MNGRGHRSCSDETLVRVSLGSLAVLGLERLEMLSPPRTLYLLQHSPRGCLASCGFCAQSRRAPPRLRENLSRVRWPLLPLGRVLEALRRSGGRFSRVCIQSVLKPGFLEELACITGRIAEAGVPVSVAVTPAPRGVLERLHMLGAERLGVGLDAASPRVFRRVGKPYTWRVYMEFIAAGVEVFGRGRVHVHLVAGLGETPREMLETMRTIYRMGASVALFRYTPLPGLPRYPGVGVGLYRLYQLARLMLEKGLDPLEYIDPETGRFKRPPPLSLEELAGALLTSGCPGCNRPFYNESPRGPIYNYPDHRLLEADKRRWLRELRELGALPRGSPKE